ncbi:thiamine pyrophosphate-dependent enzyme, partial [Clostridium sediminicola]|uniref:thiamine pyrophosphate-dependent enzyme n=1 Tax=Clostridium sediminicola TaxID=3114879 RepID=UPI003D1668EE
YCIVGDGETQEGQNWEAIMFAAQKELDNLILFVDNNKIQLDGPTSMVNNMESFEEKFQSFHWNSISVDGHNFNAIKDAIAKAKETKGKPTAIILETVKGAGIVWAVDNFNHH